MGDFMSFFATKSRKKEIIKERRRTEKLLKTQKLVIDYQWIQKVELLDTN